jgi:transcriptional regulator with XRE-family HTH domain
MGDVVRFPDHSRASSSFRAAKAAKTSRVIPGTARSDAKATKAAQWPAGMPRVRHELTVDPDCPSAPATAPVPPKATMIASELSMADNIVRKLRTCQGFATRETTIRTDYGAIPSMDSDDHAVARRLIAVRKRLGERLGFTSQTAFAEKLGLTKSTYNPFETAKRPLPIEVAKRIRRDFGISLDYLLFGDIGQPNERMALELGPNPVAEPPKAAPAPRRKAPAQKKAKAR